MIHRSPSPRARIDPSVSAGPQRFRDAFDRRSFCFRVSFRPDAVWFGPDGERSDISQSAGRGGPRGAFMKGIASLFLGIFGTFAFSWAGLILIPNYQIGHLDPQVDEDGNDPYPAPKSGMADRGRQIYAANGCVYCHSQQVRADYAATDIDRKWGVRRSAPRDYLFERPVVLGKMRLGPDLSNIGKRAPVEEENAPAAASPTPVAPASPKHRPQRVQRRRASPRHCPLRPSASPALLPLRPSPAAPAASPSPAAIAATTVVTTSAANDTPPPYRRPGIIGTSTARAALSWIPTCRLIVSSMRNGASAVNARPMP